MKHALKHRREIEKKLKKKKAAFLAFDYDGTLTPIVKKPELACLKPAMKNLLGKLSAHPFFTLAVISGRPLGELRKFVGAKEFIYAGNHGMEVKGPGIKYVNPKAAAGRSEMREIKKKLKTRLKKIPGVLVEDKGLTLSVHFRLLKGEKKTREFEKTFREALSPYSAGRKIKLTFGKKVYEIRPRVKWDKGKALKLLLKKTGKNKKDVLVIAMGDDRTDEDMFKVLAKKDLGIFVGSVSSPSAAGYYLKNTGETERFLRRLGKSAA